MAHLSDLHLNYKSGRIVNEQGINVREQDGYDAFHAVIDDVIAHDVDAVMVAGDIFHSPKPSVRSIVEAQSGFRKLAAAGIKVYSLAGNHDASDVRSDIAASKVIDLPELGIYSHVDPYTHYEIAEGIHLHLVSHHMYSEQSETMAHDINPVDSEINIFATHGSVIDQITKMRLSTDQSPREIIIPDFVLNEKEWSYRMLGHIHERGFVGSTNKKTDVAGLRTFYNGSLIRRGFSDADNGLGRGWTLWTIDSEGEFHHEFKNVWQRPQYDFGVIDCSAITSGEISELIVDNLLTTREDNLPIARQKLANITPSQHSSLDWSTIAAHSDHMLTWGVKIESRSRKSSHQEDDDNSSGTETEEDETVVDNENLTGTEERQQKELSLSEKDVVSNYDNWKKKSRVISELDDSIKDYATMKSRDHIEHQHEKLLGEE